MKTDDGYNVKKGEFVYGINGQGTCDWEFITYRAMQETLPATESHEDFCEKFGATYVFKYKDNAVKFIKYNSKNFTKKDLDVSYNKAIDDIINEIDSRNNMLSKKYSYSNNKDLIEIINKFKK